MLVTKIRRNIRLFYAKRNLYYCYIYHLLKPSLYDKYNNAIIKLTNMT